MTPTTATRNGIPLCRTCWGTGTQSIPGMMDNEICEDCNGTGYDLVAIPLDVAMGDIPEYVSAHYSAPVPFDDVYSEASALVKQTSERTLPEAIRSGQAIADIYRRVA